jgi:hypothetical protein
MTLTPDNGQPAPNDESMDLGRRLALSVLADRPAVLRWCVTAGIDPGVRPEKLAPEQFAALQRAREEGAVHA